MVVRMTDETGFGEDMRVLRRNWAESIRTIIEDEGLTLERFAEKVAMETDVEITAKTVSRWMNADRGDGLPSYERMRAVARTFGIPVANLLDDPIDDGGRIHVPVADMRALERVAYELEHSTQGDSAAAEALHDVIASRAFARLVFRIHHMRERMPRPRRTDVRRLDAYLRDCDRAADLRSAVRDAAERLVNDLTPLPPDVTDYVPVEQVERHQAELAAAGERDDSPRPWEEEDEWLPAHGGRPSDG